MKDDEKYGESEKKTIPNMLWENIVKRKSEKKRNIINKINKMAFFSSFFSLIKLLRLSLYRNSDFCIHSSIRTPCNIFMVVKIDKKKRGTYLTYVQRNWQTKTLHNLFDGLIFSFFPLDFLFYFIFCIVINGIFIFALF